MNEFGVDVSSVLYSNIEGADSVRTRTNEYRIHDFDETSTTIHYYGYSNETGDWVIMREVIAGNIRTYRYARATFNSRGTYSVNWEGRTKLTYNYWDTTF